MARLAVRAHTAFALCFDKAACAMHLNAVHPARVHRPARTTCTVHARNKLIRKSGARHSSSERSLSPPELDYLALLRAREDDPRACPLLMLAPMENLADRPFRTALARTAGGYDEACIEFMRVPRSPAHPAAAVRGVCTPYDASELAPWGVALGAQVMGSQPEVLALAAEYLARVKHAPRVDLNCGCPANSVTGNGAGSSLLRTPELLHKCVRAMVEAAGGATTISVKLRAGYQDTSLFQENLLAVQEGGAAFVTVHPRTKVQTYEGRADWGLIAAARQLLHIPVVGNGDVVSVAAARQLLQETGCHGIMVGRGAVQDPLLFQRIRASFAHPELPWEWDEPEAVVAFLRAFAYDSWGAREEAAAAAAATATTAENAVGPGDACILLHDGSQQAGVPGPAASQGSLGGSAAAGWEAVHNSSSSSACGCSSDGSSGAGCVRRTALQRAEAAAEAGRTPRHYDTMSERGKFGRLKKVAKYLFNATPGLAMECERVLRVVPGTGVSADELLERVCDAVRREWPASGPSRLALVNHMVKSVQVVMDASQSSCSSSDEGLAQLGDSCGGNGTGNRSSAQQAAEQVLAVK